MNRIILVIISMNVFHASGLFAQCDYTSPKYGFRSEKNILFGILPDYRNINDSLFLDVYYPVGSPEIKKPLVIWAFGGGFITGKREDFAQVCEYLAARGVVSATIDYRLGFDGPAPGLNPPFAYDKAEVLRAGYRGATDMKGAIRFLKAKENQYGIDLDRVWVGGGSAGAMVAINAAFLDQESEKPKEAGNVSPIGAKPRLDLGPVDGLLNLNGQDSKVQGVFNIFGALIDTNAVASSDRIAVFSYHQTGDPIVPCGSNTPYYPIPLIAQNYPIVHGSCSITERLKHLGLDPKLWETWIYQGTEHAVHDQDAVIDFFLSNAQPIWCASTTGVESPNAGLAVPRVVPNPANDRIHIQNWKGPYQYQIVNLAGQIYQQGFLEEERGIAIPTLEPGYYLLHIQNGSAFHILKWIKQ
ncbi:MAG TPA: carboxylesterase family protein [Saprospiraceae bacterium]|nr:carboxylesterase family protein [Saprospiraceae bacterium]